MFRGTTARTVLALLAAALLALPFFAPTESFASAHTVGQVEAKGQPGTKLSGKALRDETATSRHCEASGDPTGPLRPCDRHRAVDFAPQGPESPSLHRDETDVPERPTRDAFALSRSSAAHTPAALQVFRC
jgi:hypothetical protein